MNFEKIIEGGIILGFIVRIKMFLGLLLFFFRLMFLKYLGISCGRILNEFLFIF